MTRCAQGTPGRTISYVMYIEPVYRKKTHLWLKLDFRASPRCVGGRRRSEGSHYIQFDFFASEYYSQKSGTLFHRKGFVRIPLKRRSNKEEVHRSTRKSVGAGREEGACIFVKENGDTKKCPSTV